MSDNGRPGWDPVVLLRCFIEMRYEAMEETAGFKFYYKIYSIYNLDLNARYDKVRS